MTFSTHKKDKGSHTLQATALSSTLTELAFWKEI